MRVTPLAHYRPPDYPTRDVLDARPDLLHAMPKRWQSQAAIVAALAACGTISAAYLYAQDQPAPSHVAPMFQQGIGRAVYGTSFVGGLAFLGEDEARQIIGEEAKKAGIEFAAATDPLSDISIRVFDAGGGMEPDGSVKKYFAPAPRGMKIERQASTLTFTLTPDGTDSRRKITYLFISRTDYDKVWAPYSPQHRHFGGVTGESMLATAQVIQEGLEAKKPVGTCVVFYDPSIGVTDAGQNTMQKPANEKSAEEDALVISRYLLRRQVRDFVEWAKAQGVI